MCKICKYFFSVSLIQREYITQRVQMLGITVRLQSDAHQQHEHMSTTFPLRLSKSHFISQLAQLTCITNNFNFLHF